MSKAAEHAYLEIKSRILSGLLQPGVQLREEELAALCGVSRTPVRDALKRLEAEFFIRRTDAARTFVCDWSLDDIDEMFALRGMLEGHAAARCAARMDRTDLCELQAINDRLAEALRTPGEVFQDFLQLNAQFHNKILDSAGSHRLSGMLGRLIEQPVVQQTARQYDRAQLIQSQTEHAELLAAFSRRDAEWARSIMMSHIRRAFHAFADKFQQTRVAVANQTRP
ncbi:GntR family transcriptional regulator [Sphingosinicella microcystinivorans]|uniref:GntR family transcriptional regulator n=1 Tax=Sphingosinicella microcystinivorans TaxID=335406 RepID=UPI0022F3A95E|nr:GntR family transcriptional regulator [Sphingosinicella microcystinivorans]WBX85422.1 GntR family transcriptional regulator [Sphingosinicella microcystinivorans]